VILIAVGLDSAPFCLVHSFFVVRERESHRMCEWLYERFDLCLLLLLQVQMEKGDVLSPRKHANAPTPRADAELSPRGTTPRSTLEFMRKFKESQEGAAAARRASASVGEGSTRAATTARSGNDTARSGNYTGRSGGQTKRTVGTNSSGERTYRAKRNSSFEAMSSAQGAANWKANF